ncbi:unnamed protein product, partial [Linum tenue]
LSILHSLSILTFHPIYFPSSSIKSICVKALPFATSESSLPSSCEHRRSLVLPRSSDSRPELLRRRRRSRGGETTKLW